MQSEESQTLLWAISSTDIHHPIWKTATFWILVDHQVLSKLLKTPAVQWSLTFTQTLSLSMGIRRFVCQLRLSAPLGKVTRIIPAIFAIGLWHRVSQHIHKLYRDVKRNGCHNQKNSKHFQSSWSHWTLQVRSTKLNTRECASGYKDRRHWLNVQTKISNWKSRSRALFQVLVKFSF